MSVRFLNSRTAIIIQDKDRSACRNSISSEDEIRKLLSHGVAKAAIAEMYGSSWQTVHAWVRRHSA